MQGEEAIAHMELSNGELRVPRESDAERNYQPARNVLELINVCTSCKEVVEGTEVLAKEIRPVTLKLEVNKDFREWEHYLSKCMRTHGARALDSVARLALTGCGAGQIETVLKIANRMTKHKNHADSSLARDAENESTMGGVCYSRSEGSLGGVGGGYLEEDGVVSSVAVDHGKKTWTNSNFRPRWH